MKLYLKKKYYKRSKVGRDPITFSIKQPGGVNTNIYGEVKIDPVLRKKRNRDLKKALLKHETDEIKAWGKGGKSAHTRAKSKEPKLTKEIGGVSGFWREIKRRESQ